MNETDVSIRGRSNHWGICRSAQQGGRRRRSESQSMGRGFLLASSDFDSCVIRVLPSFSYFHDGNKVMNSITYLQSVRQRGCSEITMAGSRRLNALHRAIVESSAALRCKRLLAWDFLFISHTFSYYYHTTSTMEKGFKRVSKSRKSSSHPGLVFLIKAPYPPYQPYKGAGK